MQGGLLSTTSLNSNLTQKAKIFDHIKFKFHEQVGKVAEDLLA
jgi:hypothetical protein